MQQKIQMWCGFSTINRQIHYHLSEYNSSKYFKALKYVIIVIESKGHFTENKEKYQNFTFSTIYKKTELQISLKRKILHTKEGKDWD